MLAGCCLARGYWNDPELTAHAFSDDVDDPKVRIFHTGDLGRRRPDGLFEFVGRKDHLVKLRGHRIEPSEIEAALRGCSGVRDAAIVVRQDDDGTPRSLVAYCELYSREGGPLPRHLLWMLEQTLPDYMVPADLFVVDELPRLSNFKIDRVRLEEKDAARPRVGSASCDDPLLLEVIETFESVLGVSGATPEDNLPSLGGDSLQAVTIIAELEARFGRSVPPDVFEARFNIRDLAFWIAEQGPPSGDAADAARAGA